MIVLRALTLVCLVLAVARVRPAYVAFALLSLLSFPARAGFHLVRPVCELLVGPSLAFHSFTNVPHIVLFGLFFLLTRRQLDGTHASAWAAAATVGMGALVELAEGVSATGHCRLRDLLPDAAGALLAWAVWHAALAVWRRERCS